MISDRNAQYPSGRGCKNTMRRKFIEQECPTPTGRGGVGPTIILLEEYDEE